MECKWTFQRDSNLQHKAEVDLLAVAGEERQGSGVALTSLSHFTENSKVQGNIQGIWPKILVNTWMFPPKLQF